MEAARRVAVNGRTLSLEDVSAVARMDRKAYLTDEARTRVDAARTVVEEILASGEVAYGVNTGFGKLADVRISPEQLGRLQLNLVRSHACGVGEPFPREVVRAALLLRANVLATGYSGCRPVVVDTVLAMLNAGIHPVVPSQGSVGACGDLAPLAHLALAMIGEGEVELGGERISAREALDGTGIRPLELQAKEGLALINGTQVSAAVAALAVIDASVLVDAADVVCAVTLDAVAGTDAAFDEAVHAARPHPGQVESARRLRWLMAGSGVRDSHRECGRVQDAYSLRCSPQVHGAVRDALAQARRVLAVELNAATDNPMVMPDGRIVSGGNFHGAPLAAVTDYLALALVDLASISERRLARLVDASLSGLPRFLTSAPGINSGFMMVQVTAAALVSECKTLAHPASVDSIPTSANQEDHVSMSTWSARKLAQVVAAVRRVLATELLGAAQGLEFHRPLRSSPPVEEVVARLREHVPRLEQDRVLATDIDAATAIVNDLGDIVPVVPSPGT